MEESPVDVLIIGAGMAGLSAAKQLRETNLKVLVLEANNRVGGRINTIELPFNQVKVDLGGAWIHGADGNPVSLPSCFFF